MRTRATGYLAPPSICPTRSTTSPMTIACLDDSINGDWLCWACESVANTRYAKVGDARREHAKKNPHKYHHSKRLQETFPRRLVRWWWCVSSVVSISVSWSLGSWRRGTVLRILVWMRASLVWRLRRCWCRSRCLRRWWLTSNLRIRHAGAGTFAVRSSVRRRRFIILRCAVR